MSEEIKDDLKMKPVMIVPKGALSKADLKRLNDNFICVVEAKDPAAVRWMEPYPQGYNVQELAAIELARGLLRDGKLPGHGYNVKQTVGALYAEILLRSDPLKRVEHVDLVQS